jgi:hypothetical protein
MADDDVQDRSRIGWLRAILTAAAIVVIAIGVLVYGSNALLTKVHRLKRGALVGIVTTAFFILLFALAWALRVLQRRNII